MSSAFDDFIDRTIRRVDGELRTGAAKEGQVCTCPSKHQAVCRQLPECQPDYCRLKSVPTFKFISYGALLSPEQIDIRVAADGYVRVSSKFGKHMELILGFVQVCEAIEGEARREKGKEAMSEAHAKEIIEALSRWFATAHTGPEADNKFVMGDERTFQEHIIACLQGE